VLSLHLTEGDRPHRYMSAHRLDARVGSRWVSHLRFLEEAYAPLTLAANAYSGFTAAAVAPAPQTLASP
jgi:hypothetical protein